MSQFPPDEPPDIPMGDLFNDVPLFREIQRVLLASSGPVNWELARQVGIAMASWGEDDPHPSDEDRRGLADTVRAAELAVADFTGLPMPGDVAEVEAFRRAQWVEANIRALRDVIDPVAAKLGTAMGQLTILPGMPGMPGLPGMSEPGDEGPTPDPAQAQMMQQALSMLGPLLMGAQVGTVLGYLGQRVFGQFDLAVPRPTGSLYFVIPNIARFERDWSLPPMEFRAYVALHEVTHRFEFARAWVREHFLGLVRDLVGHAEIDLSGLQQKIEGMDLANPEAMSEAFEGMGSLFGESSDPEQRLRIARVQAFMAAAEGYGDHVMDALGAKMLPAYSRIEEALSRHREGRAADRTLERLLGLEMKAEQYRLGERFCATVVERTDQATLARMWESAETLPSMPELEEPTLWLARMV
ncbi:MAG TPA: zinc-dependent metalloprotease [Actinomycetota bacterium]|nr:zinc-dependent metalloprotease [Actinomycetota bacterium]